MPITNWPKLRDFQNRMRAALIGPQTLAFLPALTLGAYWFGGEGLLLFCALILPAAFAITGLFSGTGPAWNEPRDRDTRLHLRSVAERAISETLADTATSGKTTAAIALELDEFDELERQYGSRAASAILHQVGERLCGMLRENDHVVRLDGPRFAIALGPVRRADLEVLIQLASRLQSAISDPFSVDATRIFLTASVGFCLPSQAKRASGPVMIGCAERALSVALHTGPGAVRAYSPELEKLDQQRDALHNDVESALASGEIVPWFQPQVSTDTGEITGFETLARWIHPAEGVIYPGDFLPAIEALGLSEKLCMTMVSRALAALRQWDRAGLSVPMVAVNFSSAELSNPKLTEWIKWELDRYELSPERLCVEILEDVIAVSDDDVIIRNIQALAELGCRIDLDDFGTGHASIASIRRFSVNRIKIDRSFITRIDRDREQQNMVAAILTMAERLGIDTLAEGVETIGELALLAQLGCGHVQGFSIAKPMPFEDSEKWIVERREKMPKTPPVGRKTG